MKIAIWGATGHVGMALTVALTQRETSIDLYVRNIEKIKAFIKNERLNNVGVYNINDFSGERYDGVVNCIGIGSPEVISKYPHKIFEITEEFDSLLIDNAKKYPNCVFINISSGAIYGTQFREPASSDSICSFDINNVNKNKYYGLAKFYSEMKHRSLNSLSIIDLRMFAFFSRFIDLNTQYFMSDVCNSIINKIPLRTSEDNFFRDFIHSNDLAQIIELCVISKANASYDLYSKTPVSKWEIIDHCSKFFDMNYIKDSILNSPTGKKNNYFSLNHNAENIGYKPQYTSLDVISNELIKILGR